MFHFQQRINWWNSHVWYQQQTFFWSEWIEETALSELRKVRPRCFNFFITRIIYSNAVRDSQESVENMTLLMRWNKTLKQKFPAVEANQCPNSAFLVIQILHSQHYWNMENKCVRIVLKLLLQNQAIVLFRSADQLIKLTCVMVTRNIHL